MSIKVREVQNCEKEEANIFLISNTLQLINAIEAQNHFKTDNNILVLLFFGEKKGNQENIEAYLPLFPYSQLIIMENCVRSNYIELNLELIKILNMHNYAMLFTGFFSANIRRILCNLSYNEMYLLDDGTYAYALHSELYNPNYVGKAILIRKYSEQKKKKPWRKLRFFIYDTYRKLSFTFHGYQNDFKEIKLNFFTIFPLNQYRDEKIINHGFQKTRQLFENKTTISKDTYKESVYFLGQPLPKLSNVSEGDYISYIKQIISFYRAKNLNIKYIPHPEESNNIIKMLNKLQTTNFKIESINKPFELYALEDNSNIVSLASFFSSALFTMKTISPNIYIDSFILPQEKTLPDNILTVYNFYRQENFSINQLKC